MHLLSLLVAISLLEEKDEERIRTLKVQTSQILNHGNDTYENKLCGNLCDIIFGLKCGIYSIFGVESIPANT